jgi:hypothetical protein
LNITKSYMPSTWIFGYFWSKYYYLLYFTAILYCSQCLYIDVCVNEWQEFFLRFKKLSTEICIWIISCNNTKTEWTQTGYPDRHWNIDKRGREA